MAKQLREIVPIKEGWPRALAMGAAETGAAALTAGLVGLPPVVGAGIGAAHYLFANAKDDLAKKAGDWNYNKTQTTSPAPKVTSSTDPIKQRKLKIAKGLAMAEEKK